LSLFEPRSGHVARPVARSAFPFVARIAEGETPMHRIEMIVLVGLYAVLTPFLITLALH
jgi:hypothetical protein